jgi:copper(I)-binding protein
MKRAMGLALFLALVLALPVSAASAAVTLKDAWVRGTVPGQQSTGAFVTLESSEAVKLVGASSRIAKSAEIHSSEMKNGVMMMREVDSVPIPARTRVELQPGGYHVMLIGLTKGVGEHDRVPLAFIIEDRNGTRTTVEVTARVRPLGQ